MYYYPRAANDDAYSIGICRFFRSPHGEVKGEEKSQEGGNSQVGYNFPYVVSSCVLKCLIRSPNARPLGSILPPEIIRMILQNFADDKESLRACSQTARDFRHVAQSILGRHITVGSARRLKECAKLIKRGAFQHVRSLDLGVDNGDAVAGHYWRYTIVILGGIARYHTLHRLWLSELPFNFPKPNQKENLREAITTLGSTVTELGLYECQFSSYEEMVSLIRSFPLCDFLFIRDCITRKRATGGNMFAGLPAHKLVIKDLQLSASSSDSLLIDISNLIEDAELDVRPLTSLVCDLRTSERSRRVAAAVRESPVEHFQVACTEPGGFQGQRVLRNRRKAIALTPSLQHSWVIFRARSGR